jgi:hypothetical protein
MRHKIGLTISIDCEIRENNKLIKARYDIPGHSFVNNFITWIYGSACHTYQSMVDVSGVSRTNIYYAIVWTTLVGSGGDSSKGVLIGRGTTTVTLNDYKLETPITHGTGTNQLLYSTGTIVAPTTDATTTTLRYSRVFTNNSGSLITVNEVGMTFYSSATGGNYYFMICRDIITPADVNNGQQLTINYNLKTTI